MHFPNIYNALQAAQMTQSSLQGKSYSDKLHLGSPTAAAEEDTIKAKMLNDELDKPASEHFAPTEAVVLRMCRNTQCILVLVLPSISPFEARASAFSIFWVCTNANC